MREVETLIFRYWGPTHGASLLFLGLVWSRPPDWTPFASFWALFSDWNGTEMGVMHSPLKNTLFIFFNFWGYTWWYSGITPGRLEDLIRCQKLNLRRLRARPISSSLCYCSGPSTMSFSRLGGEPHPEADICFLIQDSSSEVNRAPFCGRHWLAIWRVTQPPVQCGYQTLYCTAAPQTLHLTLSCPGHSQP